MELRWLKFYFSQMPFSYSGALKMVSILNPRWSIGLENSMYAGTNETEIGLIYGL